MSVTIKLEGFRELERSWLQLSKDMGPSKARRVFNPALRKALKPLKSVIKAGTPVATGSLKRSVKVNTKKVSRSELRSGRFNRNVVAVGRVGYLSLNYFQRIQATVIEYGSVKYSRRGTAILRKTLDSQKTSLLRSVKKEMFAVIAKNVGRNG